MADNAATNEANLGGYSLDFFQPSQEVQEGASNQANVQTPQPPAQGTSTGQQQPSEAAQEEYVQLRKQDFERINAAADYFENYQREQQLNKLREAWGEEYDTTYNAVAERLAKLPPDKQALLNTVEGALLIANVLKHEKQLSQPQVEGATVPSLDRTTGQPPANGQFKFTKSQLDKMYKQDRKQYNELLPEINAAYANGLVDRNS